MGAVLFSWQGIAVTTGHLVAGGILLLVGWFIGWLLGRSGQAPAAAQDQTRSLARSASDDAFMRGISHLMADHTDQAIEEFTKAVTLNSDTVETYVVLGNLFRQKGEIERAVRIRQSIIARPNLDAKAHLQAVYDLGLDYKKGGLFNRAAEAFDEVLKKDSRHIEAARQIATLYEEMRDWEAAFEARKRLDRLTKSDSRPVLAHYKTEQGKELMVSGQLDRAEDAFSQAINVDKNCLDAYLHLGDLELARGRARKALGVWKKAVKLSPQYAHLVIMRVNAAEQELGEKAAEGFFAEIDPAAAEVPTLMALAQHYAQHQDQDKALEVVGMAVERAPHLLDAHRLRGRILLEDGDRGRALEAYAQLLDEIEGDQARYQCGQCGFVSHQLTWKCPRCHRWDSMLPRVR
ncbi:MAG: tetratricopeptide repeat protein [Desulfarculaceae bacterium]|nr:tetratricopeptide repeat protein [Desulfarculaceae bacterium]MCF8071843.1 tetratricopeptide repeat protein [Desulfarculaceae bacterium]MCF8101393.1 tetratricopeptide repeat protein [Desulfarculaceae bacterium]MCF8117384.1 tetratricopeptide repeat protein [Desulfarculaceae bacterium]